MTNPENREWPPGWGPQLPSADQDIDDDGYFYEPTNDQMIEHENAHRDVERWSRFTQEWLPQLRNICMVPGDTPNPGYRLAPLPPKPRTERVPILDALGRKNPATGKVFAKIMLALDPHGFWIYASTEGWFVPMGGMVEVLVENEP